MAARAASGRGATLPDALHSRLLHGFDTLVATLGGPAAVSALGLDVEPPETVRSYRAASDLLEAAAGRLDCPDIGLRLARQQGGKALGPLSRVMRHSETLADALGYVAGHSQAHSVAARIWIERRPSEGAIFVGHDILLPGPRTWMQAIEQAQLLGHLGAIEMTAGAARVRRVHLRHQPISPPRVYRRYFGCEVLFERNEDGILFGEQDFACRIVDTDAEAFRAATAYIDARFPAARRPVHADARGHIMRLLGTAECANGDVAKRLALHPRTLHRRLIEEGTSFQRVKDEVRRDVMAYYLGQTRLDLASISERLGFAEQAVMSRFCRKVFALSPSAYRERARSGSAPVLS